MTTLETPAMVVHLPSRHRIVQHAEAQTEASFVPSCIDLKYRYDPMASTQFVQLTELRSMIEHCLQEVGRTVYDVVAFKDIMFKLEDELPSRFPVTDMLLLSSKLFRKTAELGRLLNCFFGVNFGDDNADEHFHFAEVRILQRELAEVKQQLKVSQMEKANLQQMLNNFGQMAVDHGKAVETLEKQNTALQLQTSALEDQMALLFHQLNTDLETSCKEAYDKVSKEMQLQERLNPTRTTFRQTIDSISQQIRSSRSLITEIREVLLTCSPFSSSSPGVMGGNSTNMSAARSNSGNVNVIGKEGYGAIEPSIRFKLKTLDSNFQQLVSRFNAVKDTVVETAQEHMNALHERKKILYLSFQHIRLYDLQNAKLRHGKAILQEVLSHASELLTRMQATFPAGAITSIDRVGRITSHRWQGGYTLAALRQNKQQQQQQLTLSQSLTSREVPSSLPTNDALAAFDVSEATMMAAESELHAFGAQTHTLPSQHSQQQQQQQLLLSLPSHSLRTPMTNALQNVSESSVLMNSLQSTQSGQPLQLQQTPHQSHILSQSTSLAISQDSLQASRFVIPDGGLLPPSGIVEEDDAANNVPPFNTMQELAEMVKSIACDASKLNTALTLEDEMAAFLRTLTLSVSSTARINVNGNNIFDYGSNSLADNAAYAEGTLPMSIAQYENNFGSALLPTGASGAPSTHNQRDTHRAHLLNMLDGDDVRSRKDDNNIDDVGINMSFTGDAKLAREIQRSTDGGILATSGTGANSGRGKTAEDNLQTAQSRGHLPTSPRVTRSEQMKSEMMLSRQAQQIQRQQEQLVRLQDDFAAKVGFLRQVYEARIADLEIKESTLRQQFELSSTAANMNISESENQGKNSISVGSTSSHTNMNNDNNNNTSNSNTNNSSGNKFKKNSTSNSANNISSTTLSSRTARSSRSRKGATPNSVDLIQSRAPHAEKANVSLLKENVKSNNDSNARKLNMRSDREELLLSRAEWNKARETLQNQRPLREATIDELSKVEIRARQKQREKMTKARNLRTNIRSNNSNYSNDSGSISRTNNS